jgi:hypothetical protein
VRLLLQLRPTNQWRVKNISSAYLCFCVKTFLS